MVLLLYFQQLHQQVVVQQEHQDLDQGYQEVQEVEPLDLIIMTVQVGQVILLQQVHHKVIQVEMIIDQHQIMEQVEVEEQEEQEAMEQHQVEDLEEMD